jgi:hypothetical protein
MAFTACAVDGGGRVASIQIDVLETTRHNILHRIRECKMYMTVQQ